MSKSNRPKKLPKNIEYLTSDQVMQHIFVAKAQVTLKQTANPEPEKADGKSNATA